MNKTTCTWISLSLLCAGIAGAGDLVDKKTNNGSIEQGAHGWMVHAFGNYDVEHGVIEADQDSPAPEGKSYLKVSASSGSEADLAIRATMSLEKESFKKDRKVIVSAMVRTRSLEEFSRAYIILVFYDKDPSERPVVLRSKVITFKNTDWMELTHEFTVEESVTAEPFQVRVCMRTTGKSENGMQAEGYIDNVNVTVGK